MYPVTWPAKSWSLLQMSSITRLRRVTATAMTRRDHSPGANLSALKTTAKKAETTNPRNVKSMPRLYSQNIPTLSFSKSTAGNGGAWLGDFLGGVMRDVYFFPAVFPKSFFYLPNCGPHYFLFSFRSPCLISYGMV